MRLLKPACSINRLGRAGLSAVLTLSLLWAVAPAAPALAATFVIRPAAPNGWAFAQETAAGSGAFVTGPGTPPLGSGSANLIVNGTGGEIIGTQSLVNETLPGLRFDDLTELSYSTYRASGAANFAITLQFNVDYDLTDANTAWQGRLVFEPYYIDSGASLATGVWQTWNPLTQDAWWATGAPGNSVCTPASTCTLTDVLASFPNAGVQTGPLAGVMFKAGGGWAGGFDGNVDNFTIGVNGASNTYDFEPETACTAVCYVDAATGHDTFGGDTPATAKLTIQAAINQVNTGGAVIVAPGTYTESPNINKSLTLESSGGRDVTIIALQTGPTYLGGLMIDAANVTVAGFTITGFDAVGAGLASSNIVVTTNADSVSVLNNRIRVGAIGPGSNGDDGIGLITYYSDSVVIDSLTAQGNIFEPVGAAGTRAFYINPGVGVFNFNQNDITGNFTRTAITQASNGTVDGNSITGTGPAGSRSAGLGTWGYPDPAVWGQTAFSNNTFTGVANAITVFETEGVSVQNNFFSDVGRALRITSAVPLAFDPLTITFNRNSLVGIDDEGVFVDPSVTINGAINAELNWWNHASGPTHAANPGGAGEAVGNSVDFTPWLCSGTDTSAAAGFQPDVSANNQCPQTTPPPGPADTATAAPASAAASTVTPMPTPTVIAPVTGELLIPVTGSRAMPPLVIVVAALAGGAVGVLLSRHINRRR